MSDLKFRDAWHGWSVRGRHLVSPDGDRMTEERLKGLCWRDSMELRLAGFASRRRAEANRRATQYQAKVKVVIVDLAEFRIRNRCAG